MEAFSGARMWVQSILFDENGNVERINPEVGNIPTLIGKLSVANMITGFATGAASAGYIYVMAGSGASANPVVSISDDRLGGTLASHATAHEYIANTNRKPLLSSLVTGTSATTADWVRDDQTMRGVNYNYKLAGYVVFGPGDANGTVAGVPFNRYGLNQVQACPTTATGLSGSILNEVVDSSTNIVTNTNSLQVNIIIRV